MIEELVARIFRSRDCSHLTHWKTGSYAEHVVLGDFYEGVIDLLDNLIECYQGNFGRIGAVKLQTQQGEILKCLEDDAVWLAENRSQVTGEVESLENIVDEITSLYLKTIYKLKNLK